MWPTLRYPGSSSKKPRSEPRPISSLDSGTGDFVLPDDFLDSDGEPERPVSRSKHRPKHGNYPFYTVAPGDGHRSGIYEGPYRGPPDRGPLSAANGLTHATKGHNSREEAQAHLDALVTEFRNQRARQKASVRRRR